MSSQFLVDAILKKTKRGPYNKISKNARREKIRKLYFEEGYSGIDAAKTLGIHRNTVTADVKFWIGEFERQGGGNEITDFFYKQKSLFEAQKFRLLKKLKNESDFTNWLKIEKLLLSLYEKEMKFYLKFKPVAKNTSKPNTKLVKKVIRELAFDEFVFLIETDLIKAIINKIKCDASTANLIVYEMRKLGLDYTEGLGDELTSMTEFAKMCGYISAEEASIIKQKRTQREEQEEREYQKRLSEYNKEFEEKFV